MNKGTPNQNTRNAKITAVIAAMPPDFQVALNAYAATKGPDWLETLHADWLSGQDARFPEHGHILRRIRNSPEHGGALMQLDED